MVYAPEDLNPLEIALLGVLSAGLPPARAARSDTFRVDHVSAVVHGLQLSGEANRFLGPDAIAVTPEFRAALRAAIDGLIGKGILTRQESGMPAAAGGFEAGLELDLVNQDEHPVLLDRYLGQLCMEQLFNIPAVYPYLMERYAASGEVWRRLREGGYAR